mgnify:FL=1|tara:strand:- start:658 stop:1329 length:672 start_codon:yes stop_codon:yes gene_type:complete
MKNISDKILIIILAVIVCILLFKSCESQNDYTRLANALEISDLNNQKFKKEITKNGVEISKQNQLILNKEEALANNLLKIEELKKFKKIKSKVSIVTNTVIDTLYIPFKEIPKNDSIFNKLNYNFKFFDYTEKDNWFKFSGITDSKGVSMYDVKIRNEFSLLIADEKMGLFRSSIPKVVLTNMNPYTNTVSLKNIQVIYKKPFYKKEWFWFVLGGTATILISK